MSLVPDQVVAKRLRTRDSTFPKDDPSVQKIAQTFLQFQSDVLRDYNPSLGAAVEKEIARFEDEIDKVIIAKTRPTIAEREKFKNINQDIEKELVESTRKIEELKSLLLAEKNRRKEKVEQESISSMINKVPDRKTMNVELEKEQNNIENLKKKLENAEKLLEKRKLQFNLLLQSVFELQYQLNDEIQNVVTSENSNTIIDNNLKSESNNMEF